MIIHAWGLLFGPNRLDYTDLYCNYWHHHPPQNGDVIRNFPSHSSFPCVLAISQFQYCLKVPSDYLTLWQLSKITMFDRQFIKNHHNAQQPEGIFPYPIQFHPIIADPMKSY